MRLEKKTYIIMALDPIHVGTGGYRLGRVDNAIIREPGTRLPKIPGSSLHGATRYAAALLHGDTSAAGQRPKGSPKDNPIVYTFGAGEDGGSTSGVVSIKDARILFYPKVSGEVGPIWITTVSLLKEAGLMIDQELCEVDKVLVSTGLGLDQNTNWLSIGWLMLDVNPIQLNLELPQEWDQDSMLGEILPRIVIVHENLFSELVNSGLEVRTSVAINPETGAAADGALFTYEAIPRATFFLFSIVIDDYLEKNQTDKNKLWEKFTGPEDVLKKGLQLLEYLGVGGMGTRGFGRIKLVQERSEGHA